MDLSNLRAEYNEKTNVLLEEQIKVKDPIVLFDEWFKEVQHDSRTVEPNAVCLATCTKSGAPSCRFVLLKGYGKEGFRFFTHYTSRKGKELEENPRAALTFYWDHFNRSVRVEGDVEKLPIAVADEYFEKRPFQSQIGALCSDQSKPVAGRHSLVEKENYLKKKYSDGGVPRPPQWGGYLVKPKVVEFWQGQTDRLHDRIRFRFPNDNEPDGILTKPGENGWIYERLYP
ncbi:pyridoxine/pyridoxamine 5'-phosphate oxidase [Cylas formicarius]|uniref:pyridoxine/pyridoxamine 5'-phosphate oxidase n=1 Tax=Cylas formicarius TaxID=197179 RepID=UPI00295836A0|nr:pyridoxine/pyridoxamine 5'-phosphate oxidase [Cylas formicarius]